MNSLSVKGRFCCGCLNVTLALRSAFWFIDFHGIELVDEALGLCELGLLREVSLDPRKDCSCSLAMLRDATDGALN